MTTAVALGSNLGGLSVFSYTASTMGAGSTVWGSYWSGGVITNAASASVFSNVYVAMGASTDLMDPVLATTYIEVGESSIVSGVDSKCGGVCSATSYVHGGTSAQIGGSGCSFPAVVSDPGVTVAVPESETHALMLAGMGALAFIARRRKSAQLSRIPTSAVDRR